MDTISVYLVLVSIIIKLVFATIPYEFNHHINNNWEKIHKNADILSLERLFLHHGRIIGDVILDTKKFLGEFQKENDTNIIMSCELEIA
jgi:hypothetical protein